DHHQRGHAQQLAPVKCDCERALELQQTVEDPRVFDRRLCQQRRNRMSAACAVAEKESSGIHPPGDSVPAPTAVEFHYTQSDSFVALLKQLGVSLLVTTYQANKLLVVRESQGGLSTLVRTFDRPMGLAVAGRRMAL